MAISYNQNLSTQKFKICSVPKVYIISHGVKLNKVENESSTFFLALIYKTKHGIQFSGETCTSIRNNSEAMA